MSDITKDPIHLDAKTVDQHLDDLPFFAKQAFRYATKIETGTLTVSLPDGRQFVFGGKYRGPNPEMIVHDYDFARRLVTGGDVGVAEAFLRGEWEAKDLTEFLRLFCANHAMIATMLEHNPAARMLQLQALAQPQYKVGSKRNIHAHYDLGNALIPVGLIRR